ncbi:hypothetical protein CRV02_13525, partial [Arcobacter sp. CECT 8989]
MFSAISNRDLENIDKYFMQFIDFISYNKSEFDYIESTGNKKVDEMLKRWNKKIKEVDKRTKEDMRVIGEIVLTTDKVEQGMFKCRINSESSNPTVVTLKNTLNKMLDSLDDATTRILRVLSSYTKDDYSDSVKVYEQYTDEMRELMQSINKLGEALGNNAKANLHNGQTLENNSATMTASMNNLAAK